MTEFNEREDKFDNDPLATGWQADGPPDTSGGFCCVAAGMHMGHDEDCPNGRPRTSRGFRIFMPDKADRNGNIIQVVESSIAFEGPHVRIYTGENACAHLDVRLAQLVVGALLSFLEEAFGGELTEKINPAEIDAMLVEAGFVPEVVAIRMAAAAKAAIAAAPPKEAP